ncbi:MAG TPA: hypothetical protein VJ916_07435 [Anaerovoracaceae bacterium]|nr:hypothetical protein [Anaerovoracaceae bacterium]
METYLFYGIKRGGHHAVIQWIANNIGKKVNFHNDAKEQAFKQGTLRYKGKFKQIVYNNKTNEECLFYNLENGHLQQYQETLKSPLIKNHVRTIIIIRDIFNIMASTKKSTPSNQMHKAVTSRQRAWLEYVNEMQGNIQFTNKENTHFILFNSWFKSKDYRDNKAKEIGFVNKDKGIDRVTPFGGGSSFDGNNYQKDANSMNVLQRYKEYVNNPDYLSLFTPQIDKLNKEVFGFNLKDLKDANNIINHNS